MNDRSLIIILDREIKKIREDIRPLITILGELEEKNCRVENIRPLNIFGKSFKHRGISITPGIIIDTSVSFKHIAEKKSDTLFTDTFLDGKVQFGASYEPKYDLYQHFYNRPDTDVKRFILERDLANDLILDLGFQHKWVHLSRTIKRHLSIERYIQAIPTEIERFKQDVKLAKLYMAEQIAGKKHRTKRGNLINRVEKAMSRMAAKGEEICELKGKEKEYCAAMDNLRKKRYLAHGGLYHPMLLTPPIKDKDITINLHWSENEKKIQLTHEFKPRGYEPPGKDHCPCCSGEDNFQEPFEIGMHLGKKGVELYRCIPFNLQLLEKELERFRRDIVLVKHYFGSKLIETQ